MAQVLLQQPRRRRTSVLQKPCISHNLILRRAPLFWHCCACYGCVNLSPYIRFGGLLDADSERPTPDQSRGIPKAGSGAYTVRPTSRYTHPKTLSQRRRKAGRSAAEKAETPPQRSNGVD